MKVALIVVDGMNIANRSMVAKQILARFPKEEVEFYQCDDRTPPHLYVRMMKDVLEKKRNVVIDNGWRSDCNLEAIGSRVGSAKEFRRMLDRIALGCDAQIVVCSADTRTYANNLATLSPGVSYTNFANSIAKIDEAWLKLPSHGLTITRIDASGPPYTTDISIDILMDRVLMYSGKNVGPGIGNWNPGQVVLLVGDRHGPSIQPYKTDINLAFCDMAKAGSSFWLSKQLEEAKISEKFLYWINAYDKDDVPTESAFVERLKPMAVLSLGDSAARWCESNSIRFEPYAHPQYHKRFKFREPYPLIQRLVEIIDQLPQ